MLLERLSLLGDAEFMQNDPCLNCSLFECDEGNRQCAYIQITERKPEIEDVTDDDIKAAIIAILESLGEQRELF